MLLPPKVDRQPAPNLVNGIAAALATRFNTQVNAVKPHLHAAQVQQWGKLRRIDSEDGDTMRASSLGTNRDDSRDATYVRVSQINCKVSSVSALTFVLLKYEMLVDVFERQKRRKPKFQLQTFYGQLQHLFVINFNTATCITLNLDDDSKTVILAAVRTCDIDVNNTAAEGLDIHYYSRTGGLHFVDATNVRCLVGRVKDGRRWAIMDRSGSLARGVYVDDDDDV